MPEKIKKTFLGKLLKLKFFGREFFSKDQLPSLQELKLPIGIYLLLIFAFFTISYLLNGSGLTFGWIKGNPLSFLFSVVLGGAVLVAFTPKKRK